MRKRDIIAALKKAKKLMGPNGERWITGSLRRQDVDEHGHPVYKMCMTGLVLEAVGDRASTESNAMQNPKAAPVLEALAEVLPVTKEYFQELYCYDDHQVDTYVTPVDCIVHTNDGMDREKDKEKVAEYFDKAIKRLEG